MLCKHFSQSKITTDFQNVIITWLRPASKHISMYLIQQTFNYVLVLHYTMSNFYEYIYACNNVSLYNV